MDSWAAEGTLLGGRRRERIRAFVVAGLIVIFATLFVDRLKVDDPVGAVALYDFEATTGVSIKKEDPFATGASKATGA